MNDPRMFWVACVLIVGQWVLIVLLLRRRRFGCFSPEDRKEIAGEMFRLVYQDRQSEIHRTLDEIHRNGTREIDPEEYRKDCAS